MLAAAIAASLDTSKNSSSGGSSGDGDDCGDAGGVNDASQGTGGANKSYKSCTNRAGKFFILSVTTSAPLLCSTGRPPCCVFVFVAITFD